MKRLIDVSEAREIRKDRTMCKSIVSVYPSGKICEASDLKPLRWPTGRSLLATAVIYAMATSATDGLVSSSKLEASDLN
ncbi:hypothetical protein EVAR_39236_1 [Eumeta japonica]|uniref:Uncharacterized protein n=1 Tax=Eumeta variegata TaxID=151549 RepID=A0A4C1XZH3_EUMVA|nr:hypothetical protein EVAR_39236_1 [Eumeta japonica]